MANYVATTVWDKKKLMMTIFSLDSWQLLSLPSHVSTPPLSLMLKMYPHLELYVVVNGATEIKCEKWKLRDKVLS